MVRRVKFNRNQHLRIQPNGNISAVPSRYGFARYETTLCHILRPTNEEPLMLAPTLKREMDDFVMAVKGNKELFQGEQFIQEVWWEIFAEDMLRQMTAQARNIN